MPPNNPTKKDQDYWNFNFTVLFLLLAVVAILYLDARNKLFMDVPVLDFVILILAAFRLTNLFVYDSVTGYIRDFFGKSQTGPGKTLAVILSCPWCTGIWMALAVFFLYFLMPLAWYFLLILAIAGAGTYLQIIVNRIKSKKSSSP